MTKDQAASLVRKMAAPQTWPPTEEHVKALLEYLLPRDYERMLPVVNLAIERCARMPSINVLSELYNQHYCEGFPGAAAYKSMPPAEAEHDQDRAYKLWRANRLRCMDEAEYQRYMMARMGGAGDEWEQRLRQEYESVGGAA